MIAIEGHNANWALLTTHGSRRRLQTRWLFSDHGVNGARPQPADAAELAGVEPNPAARNADIEAKVPHIVRAHRGMAIRTEASGVGHAVIVYGS